MGMAGQEPTATVLEGMPQCKRKKEKAKEMRMAENEATAAVLALKRTPKCKQKEKSKEIGMTEQVPTANVPASEGTPKCEEEDKAKEMRMAEEPTTSVLASEGTPKCKKKLKKKNKMQGQQDSPQALSGVVAVDKIVANKSQNGCADGEGVLGDADIRMDPINEQDPSYPEGKDDEEKMESAGEGNKNCSDNCSSFQESSVDRKKPRKKPKRKRKWGSSSKGPGLSPQDGDRVAKDSQDVEDPNFPEGKDDGEKMESKAREGNKNCSDNCSSLQESSIDRNRLIKKPKRKRKRGSSSKGPGFSPQDGDRVAKDSLGFSTNHDLSCIYALCLVQAQKDKVKNFYSPRGSLIRFQRKKTSHPRSQWSPCGYQSGLPKCAFGACKSSVQISLCKTIQR